MYFDLGADSMYVHLKTSKDGGCKASWQKKSMSFLDPLFPTFVWLTNLHFLYGFFSVHKKPIVCLRWCLRWTLIRHCMLEKEQNKFLKSKEFKGFLFNYDKKNIFLIDCKRKKSHQIRDSISTLAINFNLK